MARFFFVISIILMVLSGGCTLLFMLENDPYVGVITPLEIGGPPFLLALAIFIVARSALPVEKRESENERDDR